MFEIRGGVYSDMSFRFVTPGTEERYGPLMSIGLPLPRHRDGQLMRDLMTQFDPEECRKVERLQRSDEDRAMMLLDAEYRKEQMNNMAREGLQGGFFNRRDKAAVRAIVAAMKEPRS